MTDYDEYWLLTTPVTGAVPLRLTYGPPKWHLGQWNRPGHSMSEAELAAELHRFRERGWIELFQYSEFDKSIALPIDEILRAVSARRPHRDDVFGYRLTPAGGARWEELTIPDWSRYYEVDVDGEVDDPQVTITVETLREEDLDKARRVYLEDGFSYIDLGHEATSHVAPWHPTYWKTLPDGYRLRFRAWEIGEDDPPWTDYPTASDDECAYFQNWYMTMRP